MGNSTSAARVTKRDGVSDLEKYYPQFRTRDPPPEEITDDSTPDGWEALYGDFSAEVIKNYRRYNVNFVYNYEEFDRKYKDTYGRHVKEYITRIFPDRLRREMKVDVRAVILDNNYRMWPGYPTLFQININYDYMNESDGLSYYEPVYRDPWGDPIVFNN